MQSAQPSTADTMQIMEFADVRKFRFGASVEASDGVAGKVECVVADAGQRTITAVGVKLGFFSRKVHFVPIHMVAAGSAATVTLSIPLDEIAKAPASAGVAPSGGPQAPSGGPQAPSGGPHLLLNGATSVSAGGRSLGHLAQLTIHAETGALRHVVVERLGREVLVPAPLITALAAKQITVDLSAVRANQLTAYRDDEELQQEATDAIYDYVPLRVDMPGFRVHAIDGVIWLRGHVSSDLNRRLIADQLVNLAGLAEVHNDLIADTDLAAAVSMALARDPRTSAEHVGVYPRLGTVYLRGAVHSAAARQAAQQVASAVPGVERVMGELHVDSRATLVPTLASVTDQEDVVPGGR
jgi:osmotically-inducible protein OsmY